MATLVLRPAVALQPNTRSCGNQPAHVSLDTRVAHRHADPARPRRSPTPTSALPHELERGDVLTAVKAKPSGWPTASPDPGSGHRRSAPSGAHEERSTSRGTPKIADELRRAHLTIVAPYQPGSTEQLVGVSAS